MKIDMMKRARLPVPRSANPARVLQSVPGQRVQLSGRIDAASVAEVRLALRDAVDQGHGELIVDVAGLVLGDATGLGALLGAHRRSMRAGRALVLTNVPEGMHRLLVATRLARVLWVRQELPV